MTYVETRKLAFSVLTYINFIYFYYRKSNKNEKKITQPYGYASYRFCL